MFLALEADSELASVELEDGWPVEGNLAVFGQLGPRRSIDLFHFEAVAEKGFAPIDSSVGLARAEEADFNNFIDFDDLIIGYGFEIESEEISDFADD
jgi:hypothetical protein